MNVRQPRPPTYHPDWCWLPPNSNTQWAYSQEQQAALDKANRLLLQVLPVNYYWAGAFWGAVTLLGWLFFK